MEDAFADEPRVVTVSVHEAGRWPGSGLAHQPDRGIWNFPVPPGFNDSELKAIVEAAVLPLADALRPQAIVLQAGADALLEDPLSKLELSNGVYRWVVEQVRPLAPRLLLLGGGGYNPWSVARCWTGLWGAIVGMNAPKVLPQSARAVLRGLSWGRTPRRPPDQWLSTLADPPREGGVRSEVRALIEQTEVS